MKEKKQQLLEYYKWLKKTKLSILENPEIKIINDHLSNLLELTLNERGAREFNNFFIKDNILSIDDILEAIDITSIKNINNSIGEYKYICGILWNKKRDK